MLRHAPTTPKNQKQDGQPPIEYPNASIGVSTSDPLMEKHIISPFGSTYSKRDLVRVVYLIKWCIADVYCYQIYSR